MDFLFNPGYFTFASDYLGSVGTFSSVPIRILLGVAVLAVTYIGLVVLLLLNRFLQGKYREWGIRK